MTRKPETDAELDEARVAEAERLEMATPGVYGSRAIATIAARLAREGWTPPDPLEAALKDLVDRSGVSMWNWSDETRALLRKALERGIEIGRSQP